MNSLNISHREDLNDSQSVIFITLTTPSLCFLAELASL
jgi:hypothetical protein